MYRELFKFFGFSLFVGFLLVIVKMSHSEKNFLFKLELKNSNHFLTLYSFEEFELFPKFHANYINPFLKYELKLLRICFLRIFQIKTYFFFDH